MKKSLYYVAILGAMAVAFTSCGKEDEKVTGVELSANGGVAGKEITHTMGIGDTLYLEATVLPSSAKNKDVEWELKVQQIQDTNIGVWYRINDHKVMIIAKREGSLSAYVKTAEKGFEARCVITIEPDPVVKKLPSKITNTWLGEGGTPNNQFQTFEYDNQNRLTKIISWDGRGWEDTLQFTYEATGNMPVKMVANGRDGEDVNQRENTFERRGNRILITRGSTVDTAELNANNQVVRWLLDGEAGASIEYNANGNISKLTWGGGSVREIFYSDVKSIFRYANVPGWFMFWVFELEYPAQGYMPTEIHGSGGLIGTWNYTLDGDWVATRTATWEGGSPTTSTFEYINAK